MLKQETIGGIRVKIVMNDGQPEVIFNMSRKKNYVFYKRTEDGIKRVCIIKATTIVKYCEQVHGNKGTAAAAAWMNMSKEERKLNQLMYTL